jgi:hypothetical protein
LVLSGNVSTVSTDLTLGNTALTNSPTGNIGNIYFRVNSDLATDMVRMWADKTQTGFGDVNWGFQSRNSAGNMVDVIYVDGDTGGIVPKVGFGSTTPWARYSIEMVGGTNIPAFVVGNSGSATPSFLIENVNGNGRVGVATNTPWITFAVNGTVGFQGLTSNTGASTYYLCLSSVFQVTTNTDNETCIASSIRWKKNVEELSLGLKDLLKLNPVTFEYKEQDGEHIGLIAEEVEKVNPLLISYDEENKPAGIRWSHITSLLVQSVQEMNVKITSLVRLFKDHESRLDKLERENMELKARLLKLENGN